MADPQEPVEGPQVAGLFGDIARTVGALAGQLDPGLGAEVPDAEPAIEAQPALDGQATLEAAPSANEPGGMGEIVERLGTIGERLLEQVREHTEAVIPADKLIEAEASQELQATPAGGGEPAPDADAADDASVAADD